MIGALMPLLLRGLSGSETEEGLSCGGMPKIFFDLTEDDVGNVLLILDGKDADIPSMFDRLLKA